MTMSAVDFLDQWFETDVLKATMSASGIIGTFLGVRSPGTAYVLLHHYMGEIDGAFRSWGCRAAAPARSPNAIAGAAREAGVEIRTETAVSRILVKDGAAVGVVLENGDYFTADVVASSLDPRQTFSKLVGEDNLPPEFVEDVKRYKFRGSSGKVNLALDALPDFTCLPGAGPHLRGAISISPSVDYMERAYDEAKYGRYSRRPYIDIVIPSLTDPSVAPPGKHVMSCFVQYAPYHLQGRRRLGRASRGVRRHRRQHHRGVRAEHQGHHPAPAGADAARHRARLRSDRRQHLPGRADARAAVLPAPRAGLGAVQDADEEPLHVRLGHASRRRHHGRPGTKRGHANPQRDEQEVAMADVIIIGGGHNALVTAFYLAKGGRKPLVLERRPIVGGCATTRGVRAGLSIGDARAHARAAAAVDRPRHAARAARRADSCARIRGWSRWRRDGRALVFSTDPGRTAEAIRPFSTKDAATLPGVLRDARTARRVPRGAARDDAAVARRAVGRRSCGICSRPDDGSARWARRKPSRCCAGGRWRSRIWSPNGSRPIFCRRASRRAAIHGTAMGPWSAGTGAVLLLAAAIDPAPGGSSVTAVGGPGAVTRAMADAAREAGAEIRTGAAVRQILVKDGARRRRRARGRDGDRRSTGRLRRRSASHAARPGRSGRARARLPHADPQLPLPGNGREAEFRPERACRRSAVSAGDAAASLRGRVHVGPGIDYLERAFDASKYGETSTAPYLDITFPSVIDSSMAPSGRHVMSVHMQYAPFTRRAGSWNSERDALADLGAADARALRARHHRARRASQVLTSAAISRKCSA